MLQMLFSSTLISLCLPFATVCTFTRHCCAMNSAKYLLNNQKPSYDLWNECLVTLTCLKQLSTVNQSWLAVDILQYSCTEL